jgi:hypothetical protein
MTCWPCGQPHRLAVRPDAVHMNTREQTRAELLAALADLGQIRPEWRLGQTLANVAMTAGCMEAGGVWELEDEEALTAMRELLSQYAKVECASAT